MNNTTLMVFNQSVCIKTTDTKLKEHIDEFLEKYYSTYNQGYGEEVEVKLYAGKIEDDGIYIFIRKQFNQLYNWLKQYKYIDLKDCEVEDYREYQVDTGMYKNRSHFKLRDVQVPVNKFILDNPKDTKLVPLATGSGKTVISLMTLAEYNHKFAMVILPTFIDKWKEDIVEIHEATDDDIYVVQGGKSLKQLITLAQEGNLTHKYFIFSNSTYNNYIKEFEKDPEICVEMYGCTPLELFPLLKIGVLLIDEAHMAFHIVFRSIIYTNVKFHLALSATLLTEDQTLQRVYDVTYPPESTYGRTLQRKYIDVYPVEVEITQQSLERIRTSFRGSTNYSHVALEQSIMSKKNKYLMSNYIKLIDSLIDDFYIEDYLDKDKLLIFVATVDMATRLTQHLEERYPDKKVFRYCQEDPYENLMTGEIVVSTVISAGTAVDIENLRVVIQTVNIASPVSNIQSLGRLRYLEDRDTKFIYIYARNIRKHQQYHYKRRQMFLSRARKILDRNARVNL